MEQKPLRVNLTHVVNKQITAPEVNKSRAHEVSWNNLYLMQTWTPISYFNEH